ncbi:MAG: hypothetical protein ACFFCZ_21210 [Promethearchaeota archaeon]
MDQSNYKGELTKIYEGFSLKTALEVVLVILTLLAPIGLVNGGNEVALFEHRSLVRPGEYDTFRFTTHSDYQYFGVDWRLDSSPLDDGEFYLWLLDEVTFANYSNDQTRVWEHSYRYAGGRPKPPGSITHYSISGVTIEGLAAGKYVLVIDNIMGNETLGISLKIACGSSKEEIENYFDSLMYSHASLPSFFILALSTGVILMVLCIQRKKKPSE